MISLFVAVRALRYQRVSLLNSQLADKAKECNNNLDPVNLSKPPRRNDKVSGLLSSIITAEELLFYQTHHKKWKISWKPNQESLIDQFYLQLHTTIRVYLEKNSIEEKDLDSSEFMVIFNKQFQRSKEFLARSIEKNKNGEFEKLHKFGFRGN
ncbi:hypothetical protein ISS37_10270 [candidate division KSB1 bacterium]|nr:hypothetical protein [candidate division KSB1 bacterium]